MQGTEIGKMNDFLNSIGLDVSDIVTVAKALILFVICYLVMKLITKAMDRLFNKSKHLDPSLESFLKSAIKTALWAIVIMIVASALGINITSLVAILSVAGVALSLALQGLLANMFSGITILATRPFSVGDQVLISGQNGYIRSIGLIYTCLRTFDNRIVYIPNGDITSGVIVNETCEETRRIDVLIETSYNDPTDKVKAALIEAAELTPTVLSEPKPFVGIKSYKSSNIEYLLRVWCRSEDNLGTGIALNESIRNAYEKYGISIDYDRLVVRMDNE